MPSKHEPSNFKGFNNYNRGYFMNSKQWIWIYNQIKDYIKAHEGYMPDDMASADLMKLKDSVMEISEKRRNESEKMDKQITAVFNYLFDIVQSLQLEGKPI